ncbi:hypothetical protein ACOMHN_015222 [Nucella lapillus]
MSSQCSVEGGLSSLLHLSLCRLDGDVSYGAASRILPELKARSKQGHLQNNCHQAIQGHSVVHDLTDA